MSQRTEAASFPVPSVRSMYSPNTSDNDSLIAPDWFRYTRPDVYSVTPWVSSWATTSSAPAKVSP